MKKQILNNIINNNKFKNNFNQVLNSIKQIHFYKIIHLNNNNNNKVRECFKLINLNHQIIIILILLEIFNLVNKIIKEEKIHFCNDFFLYFKISLMD